MAIAPTPNNNIFKGLVFDDIDSRDYGIYITGSAVFNSPERDVEMIEIPGRNGSYALDNGRFNNIEVTYPAGLFGRSEADFAAGIRAFRNALASRIGYKRLEDDYNPNEYRMAVYKSGLDVTPSQLKAGEFEITFDCQPQRFLKSGETAVSVEDGGTVTNPTLFEAHPLLSFEGYGNIDINGERIVVHNEPYGLVNLAENVTTTQDHVNLKPARLALMNTGDSIQAYGGHFVFQVYGSDTTVEVTNVSTTASGDIPVTAEPGTTFFDMVTVTLGEFALTNGTTATKNVAINTTIAYKVNGAARSASIVLTFAYKYDGTAQTVSMYHVSTSPALPAELRLRLPTYWGYNELIGNSTKLLVGDRIYIDLDLGAAYYISGSGVSSVNNIVELPAALPELEPGANTIEFSNTFSQFRIVPRWWEV